MPTNCTAVSAPTTAMPTEKPRLLVAEDEEIVALDLQNQLEMLGYDVVARVSSGGEACREAERLHPDLALLDIRLEGGIDGIEAARIIRQSHGVPVVFLTAYSDADTLGRAKAVEPHGYLVKPFDRRVLDTTIQVALHKGELDRRLEQSHDDLQAILDAQRHGTVMVDGEGRVTLLSRAARQILGGAAGDALGRPWREVLPIPDDAAAELEAMSRRPATRRTKVSATLETGENGALPIEIEVANDPRAAGRAILFLYDVSELQVLRRQLDERARFDDMVGKCKPMRRVFELIEELAAVDSTVLIEGETGTGKELVARAIHRRSPRGQRPFIALNCGGLSEELAASQLFGHRRGAFTGATDHRQGLFEAASGGTLFLDEIGELPIRVQTTLLRAVEEKAVMRLGEATVRPVDTRVIAATNSDLGRETAEKRFRADLLYRIRVARIGLPPLKERTEDVPLLARAFLSEIAATAGKQVHRFDDEAMGLLLQYPWPGNVRELRNAVEFAVIRCRGSAVQPGDLPPEILESLDADCPGQADPDDLQGQVLAALEQSGGNRKQAAAILGISRATLYRRLAELGLARDRP
jgi:PAS domain S-box-containing protein